MLEIINVVKAVFDLIFVQTPLGLILVLAAAIAGLSKK